MKIIENLDEIKRIMVDILIDVHSFCEKNNIKYFLIGGTLLGSIRHKGFIPWDDDIDIAMPRDDYERFVTTYGNDRYGVSTCDNYDLYPYPYAKAYDKRTIKNEPIHSDKNYLIGIDIDIFPLDYSRGFLTSKEKSKRNKVRDKLWRSLMNKDGRFSFKKVAKTFIYLSSCLLRLKPNALSKKMNEYGRNLIDKKNNDDYSTYVCYIDYITKNPFVLKKELVEELMLSEFEDNLFWIPKEYDLVLKEFYGDYMKLPPLSERVAHHSFDAYWKD